MQPTVFIKQRTEIEQSEELIYIREIIGHFQGIVERLYHRIILFDASPTMYLRTPWKVQNNAHRELRDLNITQERGDVFVVARSTPIVIEARSSRFEYYRVVTSDSGGTSK